MEPPARPEIILTHESDLDGFVSGLLLQRLAAHLHGTTPPLAAYHYQGWRNRQMRERVAWVADFVFETRFDRPGWLVLDHHAGDDRPQYARLIHHPDRSAAGLCYDLCREHGLASPELDRIVRLTEVGDLFLEDAPEFADSCDYGALVKSYGFWNLHTVIGGRPEALLDHPLLEVMATRRRIEDPIGRAFAAADVTRLSPEVGLVRPPLGNANLIVHDLLNSGTTGFRVLATLFRRGPGPYVASFRSRDGEALGVARRFDGGGHPNAAGATLPRHLTDLESVLAFLRERLQAPAEPAGLNPLGAALDALHWPDPPAVG